MSPVVIPSDYRYLYENKHFERDDIVKRFKSWLERIDDCLFKRGLSEVTRIDCSLLSYAVLDYYVDILRIKDFHGMEKVNVKKIYSYGLYWLLKKKPIQLIQDVEEKYLYLNEKVLLMCTLKMMFAELKVDIDKDIDEKIFLDYITLFYYNLKFRTYTAKSLELVLESMYFSFKGYIKNKKAEEANE
jgi:hypothetical protein